MKAFLRLWTMCLWLTAISPVYWMLAAAALYGVWRWHLPPWVWFWVFACVATVSLTLTVFAEAGGALYSRIRFVRSGRIVLGAAAAAIVAFALGMWVVGFVLLRYLPWS